jgi:hypothetical protein
MTGLPSRRASGLQAGRRQRWPGVGPWRRAPRPSRGAAPRDGEKALEPTVPWTSLRLFW